MIFRRLLAAIALPLTSPTLALAAEHPPIGLPLWSVTPFAVLLLAIAVLPLIADRWWHRNRNKLLVAAVCGLAVAAYLWTLRAATNGRSVTVLWHALEEYASFIALLGSLYVISGGIVIRGDIQGRPLTNTGILAFGAIAANLIGTTGASMLLIRPMLRINQERHKTGHIPIFFIFVVSNLGGLLTPLGDPPLFLGFLRGVDFFWTLRLWPEWLLANGFVLAVFLAWDTWAYRHERKRDLVRDIREVTPLSVVGLINVAFLAGVIGCVLLKAQLPDDDVRLRLLPDTLMVLLALASLVCTPRGLRAENRFSWAPIVEVAFLFVGIFITMLPALDLLSAHGPAIKARGLTEPWQYFWLTGTLSSVLDNAPTYLTIATLAGGSPNLQPLMVDNPRVLEAISCGAVFMGAMTYIGNGPNFMVKAIADECGYKTPSFFGYMLYSVSILIPIFVLITLVVF